VADGIEARSAEREKGTCNQEKSGYNGLVTTIMTAPETPPDSPIEVPIMPGSQASRLAIDVASDKQASDILLLDVRGASGFTDYLVIMSGNNSRHTRALADEIEHQVIKAGGPIHHREGTADSGWILLDFGDMVVHVFSQTQREYYRLEQVWKAAKELVRLQ
jgi:ribosome-associated protein